MFLLIDVGNTNMVIGIIKEITGFEQIKTIRIGTNTFETEDELFSHLYNLLTINEINTKEINSIAVASVVPSMNYMIKKMGEKYFNCSTYFLDHTKNVFNIKYKAEYPHEIGPDRIANVIASRKDYGKNVIAIDFGTAITVDIVEEGDFVGGSISPGFKTSMLALFSNTARLPQIELDIPDYNKGINTIDNLQIGIIKLTIYGLEKLIEEIQSEDNDKYKIVTTGGMAKSLKNKSWIFDNYDSNLTLKGLYYFLLDELGDDN
ncbi:MAG: type III pantothenate kinase [Thermotogota bacterium]